MTVFSAIVPIYNVGDYLERCIQSILSQTYGNFELILVDDGSEDESFSICKQYESKDSRIIVMSQPNRGVSCARNVGLSIANGEYITFIDGDDWLAPETFKHLADIIKQWHPDMIRFGYRKIRNQREKGCYSLPYDEGFYRGEALNQIKMNSISNENVLDYKKTRILSAWACTIRRELLYKNNLLFEPYEEILNEDYLFMLQTIWTVTSMYVSKEPFYYYDTRLNSLSTVYRTHIYERKQSLYKRYCQILPEKNKEVVNRLRNFYIDCIYDCIVNECKNGVPWYLAVKEIQILLSDPYLQEALALNKTRIVTKKAKCICFLMRHKMATAMYFGYYWSKRLQERWLNR